ncbi:hypothetical protein VTN31DRAFT_2956 [Thermomyces dupontii]|uniref:uncharacterized protein n=1 Tax=Talaromyces thermophilus TaxID=28565 RepID=UPI0037430B4B
MTEPNSAAAAAAATDADNEQHLPAAASAEDRKAAAALSALNTNEISQESTQEAADAKNLSSAAVQEALGKAMSRLEVSSGKAAGGAGKGGATAAAAQTSQEGVKKKAVKVSSEDVALLVEELDLTKNKATELLKAHDGDAKKAMRAFIAPAAA